jgi:hypothetical protein
MQPIQKGHILMRLLTEPEKKTVAARQSWRCSACDALLSSAYQIDHTVPLCDGGLDHISNATAMCPNCHALKTQREVIARFAIVPVDLTLAYADRWDVFLAGGRVRCESCRQVRVASVPHTVCYEIEDPDGVTRLQKAFKKFEFKRKC